MDADNATVVRTAQEAKAWFETYGISVSEWAAKRGFPREVVYAVLSGRTRGHRGQAHHVAVALGIKPVPPTDGLSPLATHNQIDIEAHRQEKPSEVARGKGPAMSP